MDYKKKALDEHKKYGGKLSTKLRDNSPITKDLLSTYYSPGVGAVSEHIAKHPEELRDYTWTNNLVAVISDGSAVLGLGDIGAKASMPVMEGKSMLFKRFADIDSVPIILDVHTPEEIIQHVKAMAGSFGAINLEDIAAPKCFEIEERLKNELDIPVFHDDQHGTAVVVLAGLINSLKVTHRAKKNLKIVIAGAGAAGTAITTILHNYLEEPTILAIDSKGIISKNRNNLNSEKQNLLQYTNPQSIDGTLADAIQDADVFVGVSQAGILSQDMVKSMNNDPIIFALSNPVPEIMPELAIQAGAAVVCTGRSDFPNQVNNALVFPGIFRGALDNRIQKITDKHKLEAAKALASLVEQPSQDMVIPSIFDERIVPTIAKIII